MPSKPAMEIGTYYLFLSLLVRCWEGGWEGTGVAAGKAGSPGRGDRPPQQYLCERREAIELLGWVE